MIQEFITPLNSKLVGGDYVSSKNVMLDCLLCDYQDVLCPGHLWMENLVETSHQFEANLHFRHCLVCGVPKLDDNLAMEEAELKKRDWHYCNSEDIAHGIGILDVTIPTETRPSLQTIYEPPEPAPHTLEGDYEPLGDVNELDFATQQEMFKEFNKFHRSYTSPMKTRQEADFMKTPDAKPVKRTQPPKAPKKRVKRAKRNH